MSSMDSHMRLRYRGETPRHVVLLHSKLKLANLTSITTNKAGVEDLGSSTRHIESKSTKPLDNVVPFHLPIQFVTSEARPLAHSHLCRSSIAKVKSNAALSLEVERFFIICERGHFKILFRE